MLAGLIALAACGCDATGSGQMDVLCPGYFEVGASGFNGMPVETNAPGRGTFSSDLRISTDQANAHSPALASITFGGYHLTYEQYFQGYACRKLDGGWIRCSADEPEDDHHGPMHWEIDLRGKEIVRAWIWEVKPSPHQIYLEKEHANRGARLAAYFGNRDYRQDWPKGGCDDSSPATEAELAEPLRRLQKSAEQAPPASVHGGDRKYLSPAAPGAAESGKTPTALPAH
jgi:hypothetical protein